MIPSNAIYVLECSNGTYYTCFSKTLKDRLKDHNAGYVKYTRDKLPVRLIHASLFHNAQKAYDFERYLKSGSGKAFLKRHLI